MVFSNLLFLYLFLPLNLGIYFLCKNPAYRNLSLIIFSLIFYAWGEPVWVCLLIFSSALDYTMGKIIGKNGRNAKGKAALCASIIINLGLLGLFKYSGFLYANINALLGTSFAIPGFTLPIGISFYTFQTMSYTIDVYRGKVETQNSFFRFLLYVSLYFQLVAGPIVRYTDINTQLANRRVTLEGFLAGFSRFILGLSKKVIIANAAGALVDKYMTGATFQTVGELSGSLAGLTVGGAWLGAIMFTVQIYFDFSGYSDMAIGLGRMFGFTLVENFNYPYIAKSATEFWRRWHISLGSFFRDYLYIPLGGNRSHQYRNLFIVWFLTGLWHGASWNFILWGLYFGFFIGVERLFLQKWLEKAGAWLGHIYLLFMAVIGWVIFYFTDLGKLGEYLGTMFGLRGAPVWDIFLQTDLMGNLFWLIAVVVLCTPAAKWFYARVTAAAMARWDGVAVGRVLEVGRTVVVCVLLLVCTMLLVGDSYNPFLYYRF